MFDKTFIADENVQSDPTTIAKKLLWLRKWEAGSHPHQTNIRGNDDDGNKNYLQHQFVYD